MIAKAAYITVLAAGLILLVVALATEELKFIAEVAGSTLFMLAVVRFGLWSAPYVRRAVGLEPHWEWYRLRAPPATPPPPRPTPQPRGVPSSLVVAAIGGLATSGAVFIAFAFALGELWLIALWGIGFVLPVVLAAPFVVRRLRRQAQ